METTRVSQTIPSPGITPGFFGSFQDVPAGEYDLTYVVTDESTLSSGYEGNVQDDPVSLPVKAYVVDLAEQSRFVYMREDDVYRIDLSTDPAAFPHENICYLSVSWSGMPAPGQPSVSDLYYDAACLSPIQSDAPYGMNKKWQAGSVPHYIYFRMPSDGYKSVFLDLDVNNSVQSINLAHKYLNFTSTVLYCHKAAISGSLFIDYCNGLKVDYPQSLWKDMARLTGNGFDGFAFEDYPYQNDASIQDKNTPFIVKKGDKLKLTSLELVDTGANTYNGDTDYITGAGYDYTFNSSHFDTTAYNGYTILSCRSEMESTQAVSNTVDIKNLSLPWKVTTSGGSNVAAGSCDIKVYVPLNTPIASGCPAVELNNIDSCNYNHTGLFESLVSISCNAAKGASTQAEVFDYLWKKIQTCHLELLDGRVLQYYGHGSNTTNVHDSTAHLLENADGRCGNWSSLFVDLLKSVGIDANYTDNVFSFWVKEIPSEFIAYDPIRGEAYYYGSLFPDYEAVRIIQGGQRFQGGGHPVFAFFADHAINLFNNKLYDATCGKGGYDYSESGFLQYLRENISVAIYGDIVCSGDELATDYFMTIPEIQGD